MPSIGHLLETKVHQLIDHLLGIKHDSPSNTPAAPTAPAGWKGSSEFVPGSPGAVPAASAGPASAGVTYRAAVPDGFEVTSSSLELKDGTASFTVPLLQVSPPMSAEMAKQIVGIRLPEPFGAKNQSVRFKVQGEGASARLEVTAEHVSPKAFALTVPLQLETKSGQKSVLEVSSDKLNVVVEGPMPTETPRPGISVADTHFRAKLAEPILLTMDADRRDATVAVSLPLASLEPPMSADLAKEITSVRLPAPWADEGQSATVKVVGEGADARLELTAEHANPSAFRQVQAFFEVTFKSGQLGVVEVGSPKLKLDDTASEKQNLAANIANQEQSLALSRKSLEETRAQLAHPETLKIQGSDQLAQSRAELADLTAKMAARRDEIRALMDQASVQTVAFAAELPFAEPGTPAQALHAEAGGLWDLNNQRVSLANRVDNLNEVIASIEGDPSLADIKDQVTRDLKAELSEKAPALKALDEKIASTSKLIRSHAAALGLEDQLLARGEFWIKEMPASNEEGSFGRMLADETWLKGSVRLFEEQVGVNGKSSREGLERYATSLDTRIVETQAYLADRRAELAALDLEPSTREIPTAYPG
ncbi:MAG TPA: hypothetical protein VGK67_19475 [Myxococcales bacterium]|jgi:hypothetical protein